MRFKASRTPPADGPVLELRDARRTQIGDSGVRRALPHARRRTVGAWCFLDHFGPGRVAAGERGMDVNPHPHCGLATVTWLFSGEILHRDSVGSVQPIRPGQLNWMTAGRGISHSEEGVVAREDTAMHGVQLWVALPEATRHGPPRFEHHPDLPYLERDGMGLTVLVGELEGLTSPVHSDTPLVGAELRLTRQGTQTIRLDPDFEHALVVVEGGIEIDQTPVEPGQLAYLGRGRTHLELSTSAATRVMLIGGPPFEEPLLLGWNFVVRSPEELESAFQSWRSDDGRFGVVPNARGPRIPAPSPTRS